MNSKRKGQLFSFDFIFSVILLASALAMLSGVWLTLQQTIAVEEDLRQAQQTSTDSIDFLVSSPGFPENWDQTDFDGAINLGLKGNEGLSLSKLVSLLRASSENYTEVKNKIGLASFQFRLWISENFSSGKPGLSGIARQPIAYFASDYNDLFDSINESGLAWDYYWGTGLLPQPDWGSSSAHYSGAKVDVFTQMLANQKSYKTMIIERPSMSIYQVNETLLQQFLDEGGLVIYIAGNSESEIAISELNGVSFVRNETGVDGTVQSKGYFLKDAFAGENVSTGSKWLAVANNETQVFISNQGNASEALVASWQKGLGKIYFVSDFKTDFAGVSGEDVFNIIGWPLDYGIVQTPAAQFVYPVTRYSFIESDKRIPVALTLVVWVDWS